MVVVPSYPWFFIQRARKGESDVLYLETCVCVSPLSTSLSCPPSRRVVVYLTNSLFRTTPPGNTTGNFIYNKVGPTHFLLYQIHYVSERNCTYHPTSTDQSHLWEQVETSHLSVDVVPTHVHPTVLPNLLFVRVIVYKVLLADTRSRITTFDPYEEPYSLKNFST